MWGTARYAVTLGLVVGAMLILWRLSRQEEAREAASPARREASPSPNGTTAEPAAAAPAAIADARGEPPTRPEAAGGAATAGPAVPPVDESAALQRLVTAYEHALAASLALETDAETARPRHAPDQAGIRAAMESAKPDLRACFEPWLELNPRVGGKVVVVFRIAADGRGGAEVREAAIAEGRLGNQFLDGCVLSVLGELAFEAPAKGEMAVTYPLAFTER